MADEILSIAEADALCRAALQVAGTAPQAASMVAEALVAAESIGQASHGVSRCLSYVPQVRAGKIDGQAVAQVEAQHGGVVRIDAGHGFAYPALRLAVDRLRQTAPAAGISVAAIRRSSHCGAAGLVAERLADAGLVALVLANTPAAIAPWGGSRALFGTNPIAFGCPQSAGPALVIDMALSAVARGKIVTAARQGKPIAPDWALDREGQPTTDAAAALQGTMLPFGGAKGAALAMMVELLAAGLTGANYAADATSFLDANGAPPATGQLILAFDPVAFGPDRVAHLTDLIQAVAADGGARLPGSRRIALREEAATQGLRLPADVAAALRALAA